MKRKPTMVQRRNEDGTVEHLSLDVIEGVWPPGTFTIKRRRVRYLDEAVVYEFRAQPRLTQVSPVAPDQD